MVLKQEGTTEEAVETPSEEKQVETPSKEEKPTLERTYTASEFKKAQSAWTKQVNEAKAALKEAEELANRHKADKDGLSGEIDSLRKQLDEVIGQQFADDPEARKAYLDRKAIEDARRKIDKDMEEAQRIRSEAEKLAWSGSMALKATELKSKYQVPQELLDTCITEEQMEIIAKAFPEVKAEEEPPKPQFDSGKSSGGGIDVSNMSPDDKLKAGFRQYKK